MMVWVFVEGVSDRVALNALWMPWMRRLRKAGWGIGIAPLANKSQFFRKIGAHAAERLLARQDDIVVGLPDYYPNQPYAETAFQHSNLTDLLSLQRRLTHEVLSRKGVDADEVLQRFCPSALKHDLEMLLLAASDQLASHLGAQERLGQWRHPVEEQNQNRPPKRVVEQLYCVKRGRAYRDTKDAPAVLGRVTDLRQILHSKSGQVECPVFKAMLDWVASKTGVPAY
jgi:hypothetical protein